MYEVAFHKEIENDLSLLPKDVLEEAFKYFEKLETDYYRYSKPLFNMNGRDLQGCRKTYLYDAKYRIVSKLEKNKIQIINIIAVGKRENFEVYNLASSRLA